MCVEYGNFGSGRAGTLCAKWDLLCFDPRLVFPGGTWHHGAERGLRGELAMPKLDDYRFRLRGKEYVPIVVGGMGVDISTSELAVEISRLNGIGHISDAMAPYVSDRKFRTNLQASKFQQFRDSVNSFDKSMVKWDEDRTYQGTLNHVRATMEAKKGPGLIFINVMEKLTMGAPAETLRARLRAAMDGGVDGITLSAGLHTGTFKLIEEEPRFRDVNIGIIVSSPRALKIFLRSAARVNRLPDYIVVEGPLAGGHLGFGIECIKDTDLKTIVREVVDLLAQEGLNIPIIPAGGIFTGTDAVEALNLGAQAVQVATRFTISQECGLPAIAKQDYLRAEEGDVIVNMTSPAGYPMRMLSYSPSLRSNPKPNCELLGYMLDREGRCQYLDSYQNAGVDEHGSRLPVEDKMCICTRFMKYQCYTCGHYVYRLKETTVLLPNGEYYLPPAEHVFNDYRYSENGSIALPALKAA